MDNYPAELVTAAQKWLNNELDWWGLVEVAEKGPWMGNINTPDPPETDLCLAVMMCVWDDEKWGVTDHRAEIAAALEKYTKEAHEKTVGD